MAPWITAHVIVNSQAIAICTIPWSEMCDTYTCLACTKCNVWIIPNAYGMLMDVHAGRFEPSGVGVESMWMEFGKYVKMSSENISPDLLNIAAFVSVFRPTGTRANFDRPRARTPIQSARKTDTNDPILNKSRGNIFGWQFHVFSESGMRSRFKISKACMAAQ